jgi:hypothetical protein
MLLLAINALVSVWNLAFHAWPITWWSRYWLVCGVGLPFVVAVGTLAWFGVGCTRDLFAFFAALRTLKRDETDDGRVTTPADEPPLADDVAGAPHHGVAAAAAAGAQVVIACDAVDLADVPAVAVGRP